MALPVDMGKKGKSGPPARAAPRAKKLPLAVKKEPANEEPPSEIASSIVVKEELVEVAAVKKEVVDVVQPQRVALPPITLPPSVQVSAELLPDRGFTRTKNKAK